MSLAQTLLQVVRRSILASSFIGLLGQLALLKRAIPVSTAFVFYFIHTSMYILIHFRLDIFYSDAKIVNA